METELIEQYASGGAKLAQAIAGLTHEQLTRAPDPDAGAGRWSIQQVVIHLQDSDLVLADRMKRVIAEEDPLLVGYDETKFAAKLFYDEQFADDAVKVVELCRGNLSRVLRKLPESAFARTGQHNERGKMTLEQLLKDSVAHLEHHLKFVHQKRALMK